MTRRLNRSWRPASWLLLVMLATAAGWTAEAAAQQSLVVYSGRSQSLVEPVIERFQKETGIEIKARYGGTAQLALAIEQEGRRSPADLFWAQDAGALESLARAELFRPLPASVQQPVDERFRTTDGAWVATSGRARVLAYAPARVPADQLPGSVFDLTDPRWRGRVGWSPANASFQAFVTAMRATHGEARTRGWLQAMKANGAQAYARNTPIIQALAAGEIDLGLPNHYYLLGMKQENPQLAVEQTFFRDGDVGNLLFVSGIGVLKTSGKPELAERFVRFLLAESSQRYFAEQVHEYPVVAEVAAANTAVDIERLRRAAPAAPHKDLEDLEGTLKLLRELGLL